VLVLARGNDRDLRSSSIAFGSSGSDSLQPAIMRTHSRACRLSVTPGNNRRSSITAESSPRWWKASRIAVASALVTENMAGEWACVAGNATRRSHRQEDQHRFRD
jgi:hypothetical protein